MDKCDVLAHLVAKINARDFMNVHQSLHLVSAADNGFIIGIYICAIQNGNLPSFPLSLPPIMYLKRGENTVTIIQLS